MADAKTVKIKLDIDAADAIKTSQKLKQQLNEIFSDSKNFAMDGLLEQMQTLTQHIDNVSKNLGDMLEMLKSVSNATAAGVNANALQTQNAQYQEQLRLLTQMNSQMQLLLNQQRQQRATGGRDDSGVSDDATRITELTNRLHELGEEYDILEDMSQECSDQLTQLGVDGAAALNAWGLEMARILEQGEDFENFNEVVDRIKQQFEDSGLPMEEATEAVLRRWADIANMMRDNQHEADLINQLLQEMGVDLNNVGDRVNTLRGLFINLGNTINTVFSAVGNGLNTLGNGIRRAGTLMSSMGRAANQLSGFMSKAFNLIVNLGKKAVGVFKQLTSHIHETNKATKQTHGSFSQFFKTVLATFLGIKGLSATLASIKSIGTEGLKSIAESFSEIKTQLDATEIAWTNFKASLVSIIQPIYSIIQPALTQLVNWLTNIMTTVAKFVAAFTGQNFIYKGVASAAKGTGKAAKKASDDVKELVKQLQGFDELNNLTSQKEKEAADTGGGGGMFDNVKWEKEDVPQWIKDLVTKIKEILAKLFDPIKKAWDKMGKWVIDSWKDALKEVWELIKSIGKAFLTAWGLGTVQKIFEHLLFVVGAIGKAIAIIALKLRTAWEENDRGVRFFEAIFQIVDAIAEQLAFLAADTLNWLAGLDFGPTLEGIVTVLEHIKEPISTIAEIARKFIVDVLYKYLEWVLEEALPSVLNKITEIIDVIDWDKFEENITKIFGPLEHALEEITKGFGMFFSEVADGFAEFVNSDTFAGITDKIAEFLNNISAEDVYNGLVFIKDVVVGFLTELYDTIKKIWESDPVQKFVAWLKGENGDGKELGANIAKVVEAFLALRGIGAIASVLGSILTALGGIIKVLGTVITIIGKIISFVVSSPIVMVITGIVAAIASVIDMLKNGWSVASTIIEAIGIALAVIGAIIMGAPALIAVVVGAVIFAVTQIVILIKEHWGEIVAWWNDTVVAWWQGTVIPFLQSIKDAIMSFVDAVIEWVTMVWNLIVEQVSLGIQTIWTDITEFFASAIESIMNFVNLIITTVSSFVEMIVTNVKNFFTTIIDIIKAIWTTITSFVEMIVTGSTEPLKKIKEAWLQVWSDIKEGIKNIINSILGIVETLINGLIDGVNNGIGKIAAKINEASKTAAMIGIGNGGQISFTGIPHIQLPRLAQGAVIPPNKEFMAVLGDQKSGTNIESPLSTMVEAFNQAGGNRSEQELALLQEQNDLLRQLLSKEWSISSSQMFSAMQRQAVVFTKQSGKPAF